MKQEEKSQGGFPSGRTSLRDATRTGAGGNFLVISQQSCPFCSFWPVFAKFCRL